MTDVAIDGGAPAPAESTGAPIPTEAASHSAPLGSQTPVEPKPVEAEAPKPAATAYDAIQKANAKIKADQAAKDAKPEAKIDPKAETKAPAKVDATPADVKEPQPRAEGGRFAPKEQAAPQAGTDANSPAASASPATEQPSRHEAPARFTADAKETWANTPEPVKAEVNRAIRELEQGHQKYKADAESFNEVREYHEMAKHHGTTMKAALANYVGIEQLIAKDPQAGFEQIIRNFGWKMPDGRPVTLRDFAAQILGQTPDEQASRQSATISELNAKIARMEQQLSGVTQTLQQQRETAMLDQVSDFADSRPRFDELFEAIKEEIAHGYDLETAYDRAERLNPGPQKAASEQPVIPAAKPPLNPAGSKSISGAPSTGSNPELAKSNSPVPTIEEALKKALRRAAA